ncbi:hypothetical protein [Zobellia uliginosa]|uniref:hypothetical protein n=1 Tax=Zobellia uliginosa TaxID=143224 RepID=UPI001C0797AB|nr:hypothetical protein [Zobellia uliginosa]MBU2948838.1 hypothetical protein [Zobellia uliginosa]
MELNYKIYRKVKIYFNKVGGALPNLERLKERSSLDFGASLVNARLQEMRLVQAELVNFFIHPNMKLPYVPASRCMALTTWYGKDELFSCRNLSSFNELLTVEDNRALQEISYFIKDPHLPATLKEIFEHHRERLKKLHTTKDVLNEL